MKTKAVLKHVVYYVAVPVLICAFCLFSALLFELFKVKENNGAVVAAIYVGIFIVITLPIITVVLMRFSPLRFVVDPFAAFEVPLTLCAVIVASQLIKGSSIRLALAALTDDWAAVATMFAILFAIGLVGSLSFARPRGSGLTDRIIARIATKLGRRKQ
ncbi:MAG: hypothetical protein ACI3XI_09110 [Eubacteriales bacterium]